MGNAAPLMCHEATVAAVGRRRPEIKSAVGTAAASAARKQGEKAARPAWLGRREAELQQQAGGGGGAATLVTVKVVMTRKEAERLIARLNEQGARERKARMAELKGQLRAGGGGGGGSPAQRRGALAPIQEYD